MNDAQKVSEETQRALFAGLPLFAGALRVKVTLERKDGTELLHAYLPSTVRFGDQVEMKFTAGEIS
jgi:hypothetical protein